MLVRLFIGEMDVSKSIFSSQSFFKVVPKTYVTNENKKNETIKSKDIDIENYIRKKR